MSWDEAKLRDTLEGLRRHHGDSTLIEVKRAEGGLPETLPRSLCAFANMPDGGTVILGVDERTGFTVTGIDEPAAMEAALAAQVRESVDPPPHISTATVHVDGKAVVIADIHGLSIAHRPARHGGRAYLRQADGNYVMKDNDLHMIEVAKLHATEQTRYDMAPVTGSSVADLDSALLSGYLANRRATSRRLAAISDDSDLLRVTNVTTASGELSTAGLYAMGSFPQGPFPPLGVTAAVRLPHDASGARNRNLRTFDGPVPDLLEDVLEWIRQNLSKEQRYTADGHMVDSTEIPMNAIREVVANALIHRDLGPDTVGIGKSVEVRIHDNRLTITSPGGLRGVSKEQLESEELSRAAVNQRLYEIAKYVKTPQGHNIIEGEGGGIREMFAMARDADLARPSLVDTGIQFTIILWRGSRFTDEERAWLRSLPTPDSLTHLQKAVLVSVRSGETWTSARVRREFSPIAPEQADQEIERLISDGIVHRGLGGTILLANSRTSTAETQVPLRNDGVLAAIGPLGKNVPAVFEAVVNIGQPQLKDICDVTGLSAGQVRYALVPLLERGLVLMHGGQGKATTTYTASAA